MASEIYTRRISRRLYLKELAAAAGTAAAVYFGVQKTVSLSFAHSKATWYQTIHDTFSHLGTHPDPSPPPSSPKPSEEKIPLPVPPHIDTSPKPAPIQEPTPQSAKLNPRIGIRCDDPKLMHFVPALGALWVRTDGHFESPDPHPEVKEAVQEAKKQSKVMIVYNPDRVIEEKQIRADIDSILELSPDAVEIGNEADNLTPEGKALFWPKADLKSFARFFCSVHKIGTTLAPQIPWIIGAMANHNPNTNSYLHLGEELRSFQFDCHQMLAAAHVYDHLEDAALQLNDLRSGLNPKAVVVSEVAAGVNIRKSQRAQVLIGLLEYLSDKTQVSFIHELSDANASGLINPVTFKPEEDYYTLQKAVLGPLFK